MRRFLIWIFTVITTVVIVDLSLGYLFKSYISTHVLPGDYESIEKVLRHNDSEILVLGSSVALNSINTKTLQDSLEMKVYSGGGNGQTFPFFLTMLKGAIDSYPPKIVVLCMQPSALTGTGLGERYNFLAPYYGEGIADIDKNMNEATKFNVFLLKSSLYKLNTIWFRILLYHFITPDIKGENGHISKPVPPVFPEKHNTQLKLISNERREQLEEFLNICKSYNIDLTIIFPPEFITLTNLDNEENVVKQVSSHVESYGFKVYFDTQLEPFNSNEEFFYDNSHLNINGTKIYTDTILRRLK